MEEYIEEEVADPCCHVKAANAEKDQQGLFKRDDQLRLT